MTRDNEASLGRSAGPAVRAGDIRPFLVLGHGMKTGLWSELRGPGFGPDQQISLADCFRLMRELVVAARDETFSLSTRPLTNGSAELVFASAAQAETLGEAMRKIAQAYNILHGAEYNRVEQGARKLVYVMDDEQFPYTQPRDEFLHFTLECALIFLHSALCELAGEDLTSAVKRIATRRPGPGAADQALAFWDAPVVHGSAVYAITYDEAVAARPLAPFKSHPAPDLAVHNRILSLIEGRRAGGRPACFVDGVRRSMEDGLRAQPEVAARLGVSVATLRRRLAERGESFRSLLHGRQNDEAKRRLIEGASVAAVAEGLGFSDTRAFTRAFKAWNGQSPCAWRDLSRVSETVP